MPMLTIKGIPDELYRALKERAERNHRSLNGEIIASLERVVQAPTLDVERWLAHVEQLKSQANLPRISTVQLTRLKNRGRK